MPAADVDPQGAGEREPPATVVARVRPFAGVDTPVRYQMTLVPERRLAKIAHERLLSRVHSPVESEGSTREKRLPALVTDVRLSGFGVHLKVANKTRLYVKRLTTQAAYEGARFAQVNKMIGFQAAQSTEHIATLFARAQLVRVCLAVHFQTVLVRKQPPAIAAFVVLFPLRVQPRVPLQVEFLREHHITLAALV